MYIDFFIMPRQSGKTTLAIKEFMENPDDNVLFVENQNYVRSIVGIINDMGFKLTATQLNNIVSSTKRLQGKRPKKIIFDEYSLLNKLEKIAVKNFVYILKASVTIFTTIDNNYNKELLDIVRTAKKDDISLDDIVKIVDDKSKSLEVIEMYNDIITNPEANFYDIMDYVVNT